jgi:hypothetical protein
MPLYTFIHSLLNVLVQTEIKWNTQKKFPETSDMGIALASYKVSVLFHFHPNTRNLMRLFSSLLELFACARKCAERYFKDYLTVSRDVTPYHLVYRHQAALGHIPEDVKFGTAILTIKSRSGRHSHVKQRQLWTRTY